MSHLLVTTNNKICLIEEKKEIITKINASNKIFMPYGITWDKNFYYIVSRKTDSSSIECLDKNFNYSHTLIEYLPRQIHQIIFYENKIWMVSPATSSIIIYDLFQKQIFNFDLIEKKIKKEYTREDIHHFNSILVHDSKIYISAHNHKETSFILEFTKNLKLIKKHNEMGNQIHCVYVENNVIYTLDSNGSKKIKNNKNELLDIGCKKNDFMRGLAVSKNKFYVGVFVEGKYREDRLKGDGIIKVINKNNWKVEKEIIIENSGDIAEVRILDDDDYVHNNSINKIKKFI